MKKVWITGGGSGIGASLAQKYAEKGWQVFISGRKPQSLQTVAESHDNISAIPCDITDLEAVQACYERVKPLDLAILNAGTYTPGPTHSASMDEFRFTMEVNYFGTVHCLNALIPDMKEKGGQIGVVASLAGYVGLPNASGYGPSKAALISLCESLRSELQDTKLNIQLINPGFVKSPLTDKNEFDMPFLMEPDDAADEIIKGLGKNQFEIAFPKPFVKRMKFMRHIPYKLYFNIIRKVAGS